MEVCLYNKHGFCKYCETCRNIHYEEMCIIKSCSIITCNKWHPSKCRYFRIYNRCKFGTFCLFSHDKTADNILNKNSENKELKAKVVALEDDVKKLKEENNSGIARINKLEEKNEYSAQRIYI